jgi:hypothetical protein
MADTISSSLAMCEPLPGQGFKVRMPTEYPFRSIVIFAAGVTVVGAGPLAALVFLSITNRLGTRKIAKCRHVDGRAEWDAWSVVVGCWAVYRMICHHYNRGQF